MSTAPPWWVGAGRRAIIRAAAIATLLVPPTGVGRSPGGLLTAMGRFGATVAG